MPAALLQVENLSKHFGGIAAVEDVSFTLDAGEMLAIIGPNGAGKSTCFNMLGGQLRPDSGRIQLNGTDVAGLPPARIWRYGVGRTFQIARVFGSMTVAENVQTALLLATGQGWRLWGRARRRKRTDALDLLARLDMAAAADRPASHLAYGDIKRLELAMALANAPVLLLMDEPTAGMAPGERDGLMRRLRDLAQRDNRAVLFTEHDMDAVFGHADRVLVMDRGAAIAEGPPQTVQADPAVQQVYLGTPGQHSAEKA